MEPKNRDAILSKEAALIYSNVEGFYPVENSLNSWEGIRHDRNGCRLKLQINLDENFPVSPPEILLVYPTFSIKFFIKRLKRWRPDYHVYQLMQDAERDIKSFEMRETNSNSRKMVPTKSQTQNELTQQKITILKNQSIELKKILNKKIKESALIKNTFMEKKELNKEELNLISDKMSIDIKREINVLENKFERGEIPSNIFCSNFLEKRKRYLALRN